jgi:hypothetical protein
MRRSKANKALISVVNSQPKPVCQERLSQQLSQQKENSENFIPSSQNENDDHNFSQNFPRTQSRFFSQRVTLFNSTQCQREKGKPNIEILFYQFDLEFTELGTINKLILL